METKPNIHYALMRLSTLTRDELKPSYESYKDFKKTHKISKQLEVKVLGANYFKKHPNYLNSGVINRFLKHFGIKAKVVATYPTFMSVQFSVRSI